MTIVSVAENAEKKISIKLYDNKYFYENFQFKLFSSKQATSTIHEFHEFEVSYFKEKSLIVFSIPKSQTEEQNSFSSPKLCSRVSKTMELSPLFFFHTN